MDPRARRSATLLTFLLVIAACVPPPAGRPSDSPGTSAPPTPVGSVPAPTGPTPRPSFVRPTPTPLPTFLVHIVRPGDTLSSIARMYHTTRFSIAVWNRFEHPSLDPESEGYDPDRIQVGWPLRLIPNAEVDEEELLDPTPTAGPSGATTDPPTTGPVTPRPSAVTTAPPSVGGASVVVRNGARPTPTVALTFDMGGRLVPAQDILAWLVANDVPATIFPTGKTGTTTAEGRAALEVVARHRDLFDVGNHSWSHPDFRDLDAPAMREQLEQTDQAVVELINMSTKPWFRPPFGGLDDQIPAVVGAAGFPYTVMWDVDTIDWRPESDGGPSADEIVAKVVDRAQGGSIVLMHLGGFNTLDALPGIVGGLRAKGLTPVTLGTMFGE